ncbi:Putative ribonuclease H protein At1g65750 [Linum perenne]
MDKKLAGWKANNLSLAGRVTLASSVLNAIPSFAMQTAFLPASICDSIDRKIRNFIWGSVEGARKIHNINWDTVCKPKKLGGLGLRNARDLNRAFLMKIVWGLLERPNELWAKVLTSKYLKKTPAEVALQVIGMSPPKESLGKDSMVWGLEPDGRFSVRSAFQLLSDYSSASADTIWPTIWRWHGPNKVKHFLWIASHNRLLTNEEKGRRHLTNQVFCPRCSSVSESISHVLLDCQFAVQVWAKVLPLAVTERGNHSHFDSWWSAMLQDEKNNIKFGLTAWLLWGARNKLIFENLDQSVSAVGEQCEFWTSLVLSSWKTNQLGREAPGLARQTH